jgi:hypothetical protein
MPGALVLIHEAESGVIMVQGPVSKITQMVGNHLNFSQRKKEIFS